MRKNIRTIPRIQIAGIKTVTEAQMCLGHSVQGSSAVGLGFLMMLDYPRGDAIGLDDIKEISRHVPPDTLRVLITHATDPDSIIEATRASGVTTVQIHNDSTEEMPVQRLSRIAENLPGIGVIKVLHIPGDISGNTLGEQEKIIIDLIQKAKNLAQHVDALILDRQAMENINGQIVKTLGGTGQSASRDIAAKIVQAIAPFPVIYAGGLTPENVADAIQAVKPYGVDVNSGTRRQGSVEKDPDKIESFIKNAWKSLVTEGLI